MKNRVEKEEICWKIVVTNSNTVVLEKGMRN